MKIQKTREGMVLVRGIGTGGTTTLATGNALRCDRGLKAIGIDLDAEFAELDREIPISIAHRRLWNETTQRLFSVFQEMALEPRPLPKMRRSESCRNCGRCVLGCPSGAKWDSREFLRIAMDHGARLITNCPVRAVVVRNGRAAGVAAGRGAEAQILSRGRRRPGRRRIRDAGHPSELGNPLRSVVVRRSRSLRGRSLEQRASAAGDLHALRRAAGGLHSVALFRLSELFFQPPDGLQERGTSSAS